MSGHGQSLSQSEKAAQVNPKGWDPDAPVRKPADGPGKKFLHARAARLED